MQVSQTGVSRDTYSGDSLFNSRPVHQLTEDFRSTIQILQANSEILPVIGHGRIILTSSWNASRCVNLH
jgi:hypothetical protein